MLKKVLVLFLIMTLVLSSFAGCGKEKAPEETSGSGTEEVSSSTEKETTAPQQETTEEATETEIESETESESEEEQPRFARAKEALNFRTGPGTEYEKITTIPAGGQVEVLSENGDWTFALYEGKEGYVASAYLDFSGETPEETDPEPTSGKETTPYDPNGGNLVDNGLFDLSGLPNKSIPYGCNWDEKDAAGLPNGVHYYENLYGKYYPVYYIPTNQKTLYLTMDEGYEAGFTPKILDILKEKNVHAVFFITKQFFDSNPELIQRMIDEGHTIGNHTCLHPSGGFPRYVDEHGLESFTNDVQTLHKLVYDRFGYSMRLFRFPEGESSELLMAQLDNYGYTSVFWSYAHEDYILDKQPPVDVTLERCLNHMGNGAVYLLHAVSESNTNALGAFIDQARAAGFEFGEFPVDEVSKR